VNGDRDWGADPAVRAMRLVFAALERAEAGLLDRLEIERLDPRLRAWRERARDRFQAAWPRALAQGLARQPDEAALLYLLALGRALGEEGVELPAGALPDAPELAGLVEAAP